MSSKMITRVCFHSIYRHEVLLRSLTYVDGCSETQQIFKLFSIRTKFITIENNFFVIFTAFTRAFSFSIHCNAKNTKHLISYISCLLILDCC